MASRGGQLAAPAQVALGPTGEAGRGSGPGVENGGARSGRRRRAAASGRRCGRRPRSGVRCARFTGESEPSSALGGAIFSGARQAPRRTRRRSPLDFSPLFARVPRHRRPHGRRRRPSVREALHVAPGDRFPRSPRAEDPCSRAPRLPGVDAFGPVVFLTSRRLAGRCRRRGAAHPALPFSCNPSQSNNSSKPVCTSDAACRGGIRRWRRTSTAGAT